jgi:peptidoglycan/xylan/chitin deacetylase (PgdA/CDA1 family)/ketosteroid isomerase-like protein
MTPLLMLLMLAPRPLLVTVDDLPIATGKISDRAERKRVTDEMLAALSKHGVRAVGLVTWRNVRDPSDVELLHRWLEAGHELGNHSYSHLDYTESAASAYLADVEQGRRKLQELLDRKKQKLRFFRFPFLREGDTRPKLDAMRAYLAKTGQRNLPVTIDTQDWSFDEPWLLALRSADREAAEEVAERYHASLRSAAAHYTPLGDRIFGREVPQILLLHANAIGAAQWDALFTWLSGQGYRFAAADEVLADPAFATPHAFVGPRGFSLWDRIRVERRNDATEKELVAFLRKQAADWSRGDVDAFCAVYAEDATFISPSGVTLGRQAIIDRYKKKYDTKEKMGALSFDVLDIRLHQGWEVSRAGDAVPSKIHGASVILRWTIRYPKQAPLTGHALITMSPTEDGGWRITQDASM